MAYNRDRLIALGGGNFRYKTDDTAATVDSAGYFNEDGSPLKLGDVIERITVTNIDASNEAVSTFGWHIVNSVVRGNPDVIDVSDTTAGTVTDTD
jgi:hypothetical protein